MLRIRGWSCVEDRMTIMCCGLEDGHVLRLGGWSCVEDRRVVMC